MKMLKQCIETVERQSYTEFDIIVVNNGSTDNSREWLAGKNNIYTINQENMGGAGGFYAGVQRAYEKGYEWFWLMDDDGQPDINQLRELLEKSKSHKLKFSNALVCDMNNRDVLAFGLSFSDTFITDKEEACKDQLLPLSINPFNGTFIHRDVVQTMGNIKKEMFIWGDETEYYHRAVSRGFIPTTVTTAIHYHPRIRAELAHIFPFSHKYSLHIRQKDRMKYFIKNMGYINKTYYGKYNLIKFALKYIIYYSIRLRFVELASFVKHYFEGIYDRYE